jgi:preprotein translocase subunit SecB
MSMTDKDGNAPIGAGTATGEAALTGTRHIAVNAQYVKDLSFENPGAPAALLQPHQPELQLSFDVNAGTFAPNQYEVVLGVRVMLRTTKGDNLFMLELSYAAAVSLVNVDPPDATEALLVETPRLLFPFVRSLVAEMTRSGGYPPVYLPILDFKELLRRRLAASAGQAPATQTV